VAQISTKALVAEMTKEAGNPVRLQVRHHPLWGGWYIEDQRGVTMGEPFKTLEAGLAAVSKAWHRAWESR
jgi:hypothetical protein